ncbi:MAG: FGGY-family carbohydrate kinase [Candidatus Promineifilaceae bacterium]|nr:FGGY-family carbohydrate kinase [Candidatus Promineifilaceae bacterium]
MFKSENQYVLAIDLGTSGPKVALANLQGKIIASGSGSMETILLPHGGAEQDPQEWWRAIKSVTHDLLAQETVPRENIAAICCTTQWSGTVPVDRHGSPLMNAIIWLDSRGAEQIPRITGGPVKISGYGVNRLLTWIRLTGGIAGHSGKDSIAHILYIKHKHPDIYAETYKFLEPKDYLNLRLTGRFAASYESITLHWLTDNRDINNIHYSDKLLRLSGVEREKFPDLKRAVDVLGLIKPEVAAELGLAEDVQVIMGTPDMHSAAIGSGAVRDYEAHLYIGTSSWLSCHVPFKKTDVLHNIASLPSAIPGRYFVVDEQETAGACLRYLKENILFHPDELTQEMDQENVYQVFDRIVERTPAGSDRVIFAPWLNGERTPVDDHLSRAAFYNLSLRHTRQHLIRAVFEGVAFNARWLLGYVEKFVGRSFPAINIIGGGAASDIWCQIHADILNRPMHQMNDPLQANTRGAAILAGVALGAITFDEVAQQVEVAREYQPNPAHRQLYDELFAAFLQIYKQNQKIYKRLNSRSAG